MEKIFSMAELLDAKYADLYDQLDMENGGKGTVIVSDSDTGLTFEWDRAKSNECVTYQGFSFYYARQVFRDAGRYFEKNSKQDNPNENRKLVIGKAFGDKGEDLLIVVHVVRERGRYRIISAFPTDDPDYISSYEESIFSQAVAQRWQDSMVGKEWTFSRMNKISVADTEFVKQEIQRYKDGEARKKTQRIFNAKEMISEGVWITPDGDVFGVPETHIKDVVADPSKYGLAAERVANVFKQFNEELGFEGNARDDIIGFLVGQGWTRIRYYPDDGVYHVQVNQLDSRRKGYLSTWASKLLSQDIGNGEKHITLDETAGGASNSTLFTLSELVDSKKFLEASLEREAVEHRKKVDRLAEEDNCQRKRNQEYIDGLMDYIYPTGDKET